jgi:hypothetical protein
LFQAFAEFTSIPEPLPVRHARAGTLLDDREPPHGVTGLSAIALPVAAFESGPDHPGAGGMYCGNCFRDNALVAALRRQGHDTLMVPLYLPMTLR